jgi:hypothetical protein
MVGPTEVVMVGVAVMIGTTEDCGKSPVIQESPPSAHLVKTLPLRMV